MISSTKVNIPLQTKGKGWQNVLACMYLLSSPFSVFTPPSREIKTVNAWFQNKRASSKKRTKPVSSQQDNSSVIHLSSTQTDFFRLPDTDDFHDDEYPSLDIHHSRAASLGPSDMPSSFYTGHSDHSHFYTESDSIP